MHEEMSIFEQVKEMLTYEEVADFYGLSVIKHKILCIFHDENNPSLSFKGNIFTCFSCGAKGSVIDLAMKILETDKVMEAIERLNEDFDLELDLKRSKKSNSKIVKMRNEREQTDNFDKWWTNTYCLLFDTYHLYQNIIDICAPKREEDLNRISSLYLMAINNIDYVEYKIDSMLEIGNDFEKKVEFYKLYGKEVIENDFGG